MNFKSWKTQFIFEEAFSIAVTVFGYLIDYKLFFFLGLMNIFGIVPRRAFLRFIQEVQERTETPTTTPNKTEK
ncbi:hypothetical protein BMI90_10660 [Thioclava sp. L04-15]|uniref:hypothetical protein n=1 Tax=Thioclava sp. L04-15 TaxID=1915318 RepID=UPI0009986A8B|nr:hypothetical protein [Thioclava sp. L04-15]OOY27677.1 hypothetical protein BMI90_10660 [Thioclava sp. L04-15]TNE91496.1 MAG: hypothetical protein EP337_06380 [Paracoccaceae bacterium]